MAMGQGQIHVLIVEDEELLRTGYEIIIQAESDMNVIGAAENGRKALELLRVTKPDIVLLDLDMPVMSGIDCIQEIRKLYSDLPILILSSYSDDEYIFQGLAYGANGYILKGNKFDTLVQTIRDVMDDKFVLAAEVGRQIAQYVLKNNSYMKERGVLRYFQQNNIYSKQEQEIILLLLARLANKDIAEQLHFSEGTIKNKLTIIYEKIGVSNRLEAIEHLEKHAVM